MLSARAHQNFELILRLKSLDPIEVLKCNILDFHCYSQQNNIPTTQTLKTRKQQMQKLELILDTKDGGNRRNKVNVGGLALIAAGLSLWR